MCLHLSNTTFLKLSIKIDKEYLKQLGYEDYQK